MIANKIIDILLLGLVILLNVQIELVRKINGTLSAIRRWFNTHMLLQQLPIMLVHSVHVDGAIQ